MIPERFEGRRGLVHAAHLQLLGEILLPPRHLALALGHVFLTFDLGLGILVGIRIIVALDEVVEVFRFLLHQTHPFVRRGWLDVVFDLRFRKSGAQRFEVVGEVVNHLETLPHGVDGDTGVRGERAEIPHHLRLHRHLIFRKRIQRVDHDRRDVARRAGKILRPVREKAGRYRLGLRLCRAWSERRALETEERHFARLAALHDGDLVFFQVGNGVSLLVRRDHGELDERRSRTKDRRGFLLGGKGHNRRGKCHRGSDKFSHPLTVDDGLQPCKNLFQQAA